MTVKQTEIPFHLYNSRDKLLKTLNSTHKYCIVNCARPIYILPAKKLFDV